MYPANITRAEAQARSALIATHQYAVSVDLSGRYANGAPLEHPDETFVSTSEILFSSGAGETHLDLIADHILEISLDSELLDATQFTGERFPLVLEPGEHVLRTTALCRYSRTGEGLHRFVDPVDDAVYCYTQLEVADSRRVYACFEQPDLKAAFTFTITAPASWTVLSNSPAVQPADLGDGFAQWAFDTTPPISTYITAVIAGHYASVYDTYRRQDGTLPLSLHCRQSVLPHLDAQRIFDITKAGFEVFEHHFGTPHPFDDYAQIFVPEFNSGAMENAGCVTIRDEYLFRSRVTAASYEARDNTILHELAHMWFGDLVTMTWWDDLWLNESFAEWASHFAQEQIAAKTSSGLNPWATFCNNRKTWAYRQDQLPSTHPIAADMVDLEAVELNFDGITYAKGASALRQLVAFVGQDHFLAGVRTYFRRHAFRNTQLADLLAALTEASGRDLSHFADQWLQQPGVNLLEATFDVDEDGRFTRFSVLQSAPERWPTLRQHRIAIGLYDQVSGRLRRTTRVEVDIAGPETAIVDLIGRARPALILLNDGDLSYAKIRLDSTSLAAVVQGIHTFEDPLARALCWGATWDMCRDAEMSAADYVELALRGVGTETDLTAVGAVLAQAKLAVDYYSPRVQRHTLNARFAAGVADLLAHAEPGSDHQLAFARALSNATHDAAGAAVLQNWLAGAGIPEGLQLDADLRWRLVWDLARVGMASDEVIDAELARDNTATGAEKAAGARAIRPDAAAKAAAWERAVGDDLAPNETHFQICSAFWQLEQDAVLRPYLDRYLDVVHAISEQRDDWDRRSPVLRQHVLNLLFPRPLADRAFLDRLEAWMAATPLSHSVQRVLGERRDDALRALRCQEARH